MLDKTRNAKPAAITKEDRNKLRMVIAVDSGPHATERQRTEAAQIFNALKFTVIGEPR